MNWVDIEFHIILVWSLNDTETIKLNRQYVF